MIIYLEKKYKNNRIAKKIISKYKNPQILEIDNYKNIFDKKLSWDTKNCIIIAGVNNAISKIPYNYGHPGVGFFFKNSLNCVYDCDYCYLKWFFKNNIQVYFVNYKEIQSQIKKAIAWEDKNTQKWFYSSDYSDNLATDNLTDFSSNFLDFFEKLENTKMEVRTKSVNISHLLARKPAKNTEIAFSLNPQEIIKKYENKTPSLDLRIQAINKLLDAGWLVGIRFIPLLEVENYKEIYNEFVEYIAEKIDFTKIYSVFVWGLLYTKGDYTKMLNKAPNFELLYDLKKNDDWYYRESIEAREYFYKLFDEKINNKCYRCLDD